MAESADCRFENKTRMEKKEDKKSF